MPRKTYYGAHWTEFYHPVKGDDRDPGRITIIQWGPAHLGLRDTPEVQYGPSYFTKQHPELFKTGSTSAPEGWFFWGCLQELGEEGQEGGWSYQRKVGAAKVGSAIVDFVIDTGLGRPIACRIVTPYFHEEFGPAKAESDRLQVDMLTDAGYDVVDAFSRLYMMDPSGGAVRNMVKRVVAKDPGLIPGSATYLGD